MRLLEPGLRLSCHLFRMTICSPIKLNPRDISNTTSYKMKFLCNTSFIEFLFKRMVHLIGDQVSCLPVCCALSSGVFLGADFTFF